MRNKIFYLTCLSVIFMMDILADRLLVSDKKMNAIGFRHDMLRKGTIHNTWNEAHPRTVIGYSKDQKKSTCWWLTGYKTIIQGEPQPAT